MKDVVDRVISTFGMMRSLTEEGLEESRADLNTYIEKLSSAGETDPQRLAVFGLAYLRERHGGSSSRLTGC